MYKAQEHSSFTAHFPVIRIHTHTCISATFQLTKLTQFLIDNNTDKPALSGSWYWYLHTPTIAVTRDNKNITHRSDTALTV